MRYVSQLKGSSDISDGKTRGDDLITFSTAVRTSGYCYPKEHLELEWSRSGRGGSVLFNFSNIDVIKLKRTIISRLS